MWLNLSVADIVCYAADMYRRVVEMVCGQYGWLLMYLGSDYPSGTTQQVM